MNFDPTPEQVQLRDAVKALGKRYGHAYFVEKAKTGGHTDELWAEAGKLGYPGVSGPTQDGGGGGGITHLALVAQGKGAPRRPPFLLVLSPPIPATPPGPPRPAPHTH